ncbi:MAG: response regulator [Clostridia bacterium]
MAAPLILIAEDDAHQAFLAERAFRDAGVAEPILAVATGDEAIAALASRPLPRVVLLDHDLPGRSGLEVLAWIRAQQDLSFLPVLIVSGSSHPSDARAAYLLGANGYVAKPSTYEELARLARAVAEYWLGFNVSA